MAAGAKQVLQVERKGIEPVEAGERHGRPSSIFTLWFGANVEFATLVTGALATAAFGLNFWQALVALVIGNLLGAVFLGLLSTFGPQIGVPQLIQSRRAFGYYGNFVPGILNFFAGFSWFAVNTVLGVFALEWLIGVPFAVALAIMVIIQVAIAIYGYNLIHAIERYMAIVLTVVFLIVSVYGFAHAHLNLPFNAKTAGPMGLSGAFMMTLAISFSYVLGWMAFASDYTRYLPADTRKSAVFSNAFISMLVSGIWLEALGAALGTLAFIAVPTDLVTHLLPHALGIVTMLAVVIGTVTANVLNIYSGALSSLVIDLPLKRWAAALVVGALGTIVSWLGGQHNYWEHYQNFLFLLAYWVTPWLAVMVVDFFIVQRGRFEAAPFYDRGHAVGAGFYAWLIAILVSVPFMNVYGLFVGPFATANPGFGDVTYFVSFIVAGLIYLFAGRRPRTA